MDRPKDGNDTMLLQQDHQSADDQTLEAPAVPKKKRAKRLPAVKGRFTAKQAGDALAMEG
jgi:hypothetical protein